MSDLENSTGAINPQGDSYGDVSGKAISFPLNAHGEREVKVDNSISEVVDNVVDDASKQQVDLTPTEAVAPTPEPQESTDSFQSRYKELQAYTTRTAQENARLREAYIALQKDMEYAKAFIQGSTPPAEAEDWSEIQSSKEKFDAFLRRRDEASEQRILQQVAGFLSEYLQNDPVRQESNYRMQLDRAVNMAVKDKMDFKAMRDDILAYMDVNRNDPNLTIEKAYQVVAKLAPKPLAGVAVQGAASNKALQEKAKRFNSVEVNQKSTDLSRPQLKPVEPGDSREMMRQAFDNALEFYGLS